MHPKKTDRPRQSDQTLVALDNDDIDPGQAEQIGEHQADRTVRQRDDAPEMASANLSGPHHYLEIATPYQNAPGNPRELVGERDDEVSSAAGARLRPRSTVSDHIGPRRGSAG